MESRKRKLKLITWILSFLFLKPSENYGDSTPSLNTWAKALIQELWSFERHLFDPRKWLQCRARLNTMETTLLVSVRGISMLHWLRMIHIFSICMPKSRVRFLKGSMSHLIAIGSATMTQCRSLCLPSRTEARGVN